MRDIRILPPVLDDLVRAAGWYDEHGYAGLGDRFLETFYTSLPHIQRHGEIFRPVYQDFRKLLSRPFPYSVFYRLHSDIWIVPLVIHAARNPDAAQALLQKRK